QVGEVGPLRRGLGGERGPGQHRAILPAPPAPRHRKPPAPHPHFHRTLQQPPLSPHFGTVLLHRTSCRGPVSPHFLLPLPDGGQAGLPLAAADRSPDAVVAARRRGETAPLSHPSRTVPSAEVR